MRVIAGKYRGRTLKSPADLRTRPTSDRLRETIFNVIAPRIDDGTRFLDLCAGTGAIGIEALSRGAEFATFVDKSRKSCALIETNLDLLGVPEAETEVVASEAKDFLSRANKKLQEENSGEQGWDIIYFDPPYSEEYKPILDIIGWENARILREDGVVIAEHHHKNELPDAVQRLRRWRILKQGDSCLSFYEIA
jgi:16S rRNA (guanine966-N2)-methyltransferase